MIDQCYLRVMPRDLFNEANLLKCYGALYIELEKIGKEGRLQHRQQDYWWLVGQDEADGSLSVDNIELVVHGCIHHLFRPLNSRDPYPLYVRTSKEEEVSVFNDDGTLSDEFKAFLNDENYHE